MALSVLIIEDEIIIGLLLGDLLADMGHEVCAISTTVAEAVAAAGESDAMPTPSRVVLPLMNDTNEPRVSMKPTAST